METVKTPFLFVNPKSYLYGKQSLALAQAADELVRETGVQIFFTCPYADLRLIAEHTQYITVTAQNMDALVPGRGMGAVLPESLVEAGAKAVVLNHAENQKTVAEPTALIGTGTTADDDYTIQTTRAIKAVDPNVKVMIASGITTAEDCYKVVFLGADGTGSISGIVKAPDPALRVKEMVSAIMQAMKDRKV